eukprot:5934232-Prymnesium_polylepis.1
MPHSPPTVWDLGTGLHATPSAGCGDRGAIGAIVGQSWGDRGAIMGNHGALKGPQRPSKALKGTQRHSKAQLLVDESLIGSCGVVVGSHGSRGVMWGSCDLRVDEGLVVVGARDADVTVLAPAGAP